MKKNSLLNNNTFLVKNNIVIKKLISEFRIEKVKNLIIHHDFIYLKNEIMKVFFNKSIFSFCAYTSTNSFFLSFCNIFFTSEQTTVWCLLQKVLGSPLHLLWMILKFITSAFSKYLSGSEINLSFFNWSMYVSSSSFSNHFRSFRTTLGIYLLKYFQIFYWCTRRTKCSALRLRSVL